MRIYELAQELRWDSQTLMGALWDLGFVGSSPEDELPDDVVTAARESCAKKPEAAPEPEPTAPLLTPPGPVGAVPVAPGPSPQASVEAETHAPIRRGLGVMRAFEAAQRYKIPVGEIMKRLAALGRPLRDHLTPLDKDDITELEKSFAADPSLARVTSALESGVRRRRLAGRTPRD